MTTQPHERSDQDRTKTDLHQQVTEAIQACGPEAVGIDVAALTDDLWRSGYTDTRQIVGEEFWALVRTHDATQQPVGVFTLDGAVTVRFPDGADQGVGTFDADGGTWAQQVEAMFTAAGFTIAGPWSLNLTERDATIPLRDAR